MSLKRKSILLIILILLIDQTVKILIKTNMVIGQEFPVLGNWFRIHFLENNGMAFGMELWGSAGKTILSLFRLLAIVAIGWYLNYLIRKKEPAGLVLCVSAIMAGAIGNLIDSAFYGMIFSESWHTVAVFFPEGGGYSTFLHGRVVDMLYFPVIDTHWPDWSPIKAGEEFIFFRPVFNLADSSIFIGVTSILIFHKKFLVEEK
jgi:signal peptidase II